MSRNICQSGKSPENICQGPKYMSKSVLKNDRFFFAPSARKLQTGAFKFIFMKPMILYTKLTTCFAFRYLYFDCLVKFTPFLIVSESLGRVRDSPQVPNQYEKNKCAAGAKFFSLQCCNNDFSIQNHQTRDLIFDHPERPPRRPRARFACSIPQIPPTPKSRSPKQLEI